MLGPKRAYAAEVIVTMMSGVGTFGQLFVLALPEIRAPGTDVYFFLYTLSLKEFSITISTKWRSPEVSQSYTVSRNKHQKVKVNEVFTATDMLTSRWTHLINGTGAFQMSVMVYLRSGSYCSTMQAVPMDGWGKYYLIVTPRYLPSLQIVNGPDDQTVNIYYVSEYKQSLQYNNHNFGNMWTIPVNLRSFEGISMQNCTQTRGLHGSLTGTHLNAARYPVGVIVGSCLVIDDSSRVLADTALDMILLMSSFGKTFITFPLTSPGATSYLVLSATDSFVDVTIHQNNGRREIVHLSYTYDPERIENANYARLIVGNKLIQVHFFLEMTCVGRMICGDQSMSVIVPAGLYMDNYYWILKSWKKTSDVQGLGNWQSSEFSVVPGNYYMHSTRGYRYAAYLFGSANTRTYIQPAGYISAAGEKESCNMRGPPVPGDMIDDDCDGRVDEEASDGTGE
ncbi:hypothetical protein Btru_014809 [Bulinus truncatus]|nr:hypothetical protein Btru_014809 [Bulinus truncatus]